MTGKRSKMLSQGPTKPDQTGSDGIGVQQSEMFNYSVYSRLGNFQIWIIPFCATVKNITPSNMDGPMNCCLRPKGNSSSGHPQHRGGDNLTVAQKDLK